MRNKIGKKRIARRRTRTAVELHSSGVQRIDNDKISVHAKDVPIDDEWSKKEWLAG